jgi:hypothetical protein
MRVYHGCSNVFVTEEFLYRPDIVTILKKMGGKRVAQGMAAAGLVDAGCPNGLFDGVLEHAFIEMMSPDDSGTGILRAF